MTKTNSGQAHSADSVQLPTPDNTKKPLGSKNEEAHAPNVTGKRDAITITTITMLTVVALGVYYLIIRNSDTLFMAQSKSFFSFSCVFLDECMKQPGGFVSYAASFLTQFFYYPALGASIMIAIWMASIWVSKIAFKIPSIWMAFLALPVSCLLIGVIDTGYWIYYIKQTGYWFYGTVGYLAAMLLVLLYSLTKKHIDRAIMMTLIALSYFFFGWYSLLALVYAIVLTLKKKADSEKRSCWLCPIILGVILLIAVPLISYSLYTEIRLEDMWTIGFPPFTNDSLHSLQPEMPYIIMAILPLGFTFLPKVHTRTWLAYVATAICIAISFVSAERHDFQNYNYHAEMRMYRAADEQDWDKVLDEMANIPGDASRQMVLLKNIALLNKGEMGEKMFRYNNMGQKPENGFDTLHVHMVQTAAPLIYYYHGKTNFATRWCIENSVEFGYDFDNLKMLTRCALVGGEMDVARKYLEILQTSIFHKKWADHLMPITYKPELLKKYPEFDTVCELRDHMGTVLDGDNGLCEMYLLNYFSNTMNKDSKLLQELTLNYAMVQKDISLFWPRFFLYAQLHPETKMPTHYQEAALLYGKLEPDNVDISHMPFDDLVKERYDNFHQMSQQLLASGLNAPAVGEAMKSSYGDTFFWFYFFCRDIQSY